jgi:hypothetical protein
MIRSWPWRLPPKKVFLIKVDTIFRSWSNIYHDTTISWKNCISLIDSWIAKENKCDTLVCQWIVTSLVDRYKFGSCSWRFVLDTTLCDKICQWLATGQWFSPVSSTNKTDRHNITETLLKVALNTINQPTKPSI